MPDRTIDELLALDEATLRRLLEAGRALVAHLDLDGILELLLDVATELTGAREAAIGVIARPATGSSLGVPIVIRGEVWGALHLTEKRDATEFTAADEQTATVLAGWAGIAIDNARLYEGVQVRKQELERAVEGLEATTAIVRAIGTETDVGRVLELIVTRGRALIDARSLVLLLAEGTELVVAASAGQVESRAVGSRIPIGGTAAGEVLSAAGPTRMTDAQTMLRLEDAGLGVVGAETGMLVPLVYRQHALGMLAAFDSMTGDGQFDAAQESLLVTFAASAATAVATAKTVERERLHDSLAAAESERRRWARELHDDTLQGLAGLSVLLASAGPDADRRSVDLAVGLVAERIQEQIEGVRTLITELRPAALDQLGLKPALESLLARIGTVEGLDVTGDLEIGSERLDPELETTIYRFAQEALTNVAKHARAEHLRVRMRRAPGTIELEIADDGSGFDPARRGDGFGLVGMKERAGLVGGAMRVESSVAGTTVHGSFPA
ncbi:GAF domain-containing sensor histidine kinase [Solirubrobacter ginsenosidimutans]|uniref:histidine kinase n=1 Tax=Solirubrobacter ginsenosidimutans TaxID=490573 RepID=A0A9X3N1H8_9ACTN|nr:GAF domain-containing sensor histidine kinase [Solirubrobacter ginsenosidimutans]MDA0163238.1 GAF domain-containing sensor histidine kinase [Solirubrobacter ginsenosidimutans]